MGKPMEKKRKKGRPSLLDLQKRSLRLQKQQEKQMNSRSPNPNSISNPYARFPNPSACRRTLHRNLSPEPMRDSPSEEAGTTASMEDDEDDDEPKDRRKEKKLKLVLHLPHPNTDLSDSTSIASESNGAVCKKRKIDTAGKEDGKNPAWKATETPQDESDLGPTTPLPEKKLLNFILDRLQKKDAYGVFSEPVDPEELPDYYDIIKHPMDFGTLRKRLSIGAYKNLEEFENDVFLICSNAMRYNAPDTIYFRQTRSILELAKKSFETLRRQSDGSEQEPRIVRRGRPPGSGKNNAKQPAGRPPSERAGSEFSFEASLKKAVNGSIYGLRNDSLRRGSGLDQQNDVSVRPSQFIHGSEAYIFGSERISERNEDFSGSMWKGSLNCGKKFSFMEESRRSMYKSSSTPEFSSPVDGDRKILLQVGFHVEYSYARSLARFAANLGPIGWKIAARRIERTLPLGINFGPGWVGEIDATQPHRPQIPKPSLSPCSSSVLTGAGARDRIPDTGEAKVSSLSSSSQFQHCSKTQHLANGLKAPLSPQAPANFGLEAVIVSTVSAREPPGWAPPALGAIHLPSSSKGAWPAVPVESQQPDLVLQL